MRDNVLLHPMKWFGREEVNMKAYLAFVTALCTLEFIGSIWLVMSL